MRKVQTNCPNCGSVMDSDKCQYCGTILYDFACLDADQPFYMKVKLHNRIVRIKAMITNFIIEHHSENLSVYADNSPFITMKPEPITIHADFEAIQENGILYMVIDTDQVNPDARPY